MVKLSRFSTVIRTSLNNELHRIRPDNSRISLSVERLRQLSYNVDIEDSNASWDLLKKGDKLKPTQFLSFCSFLFENWCSRRALFTGLSTRLTICVERRIRSICSRLIVVALLVQVLSMALPFPQKNNEVSIPKWESATVL